MTAPRAASIACMVAQLLACAGPVLAAAPIHAAPREERTRNRTGMVASAAGLAAGVGLAVWLKSEADDRYDDYLRLADPARATAAYRSAERYDRASLIGWGTAQLSFIALLYFLTREDARPLVPVEGEPILRAGAGGLEVGFRVAL